MATLREVLDPRDPEFLDIYSFQSTSPEPDEPIAEQRFEDLAAALEFVTREWSAKQDRFVNEGVAQDEYADYLASVQGAG